MLITCHKPWQTDIDVRKTIKDNKNTPIKGDTDTIYAGYPNTVGVYIRLQKHVLIKSLIPGFELNVCTSCKQDSTKHTSVKLLYPINVCHYIK